MNLIFGLFIAFFLVCGLLSAYAAREGFLDGYKGYARGLSTISGLNFAAIAWVVTILIEYNS